MANSAVHLALGLLIASQPWQLAWSQTYPAKPVKIITADAGNFVDVVARRVGSALSQRWNQPVLVENRPGAGLTIGTAAAARSPADGYTLALTDRTALSVAPSLYKSLSYEVLRDLAPITLVAKTPLILVAHSAVPAENLAEFIQYLKARPGTPLMTSGGATGNHLANEVLRQFAALEITNVHYKGSPPAVAGLLAGETKGGFMLPSLIIPHVNTGKVKAYAITSATRFAGTPGIPAVTELGAPELETEYWIAMMAPAGIALPIRDKLNRDLVDVINEPSMRAFLETQGASPSPSTPAELASLISSETVKWKKVIEAAGISLE